MKNANVRVQVQPGQSKDAFLGATAYLPGSVL